MLRPSFGHPLVSSRSSNAALCGDDEVLWVGIKGFGDLPLVHLGAIGVSSVYEVDAQLKGAGRGTGQISGVFSLQDLYSLTAEKFRYFLYFKNNRHWTATQTPPSLRGSPAVSFCLLSVCSLASSSAWNIMEVVIDPDCADM